MKTKKLLALLLALVMVFSLTACGSDNADDASDAGENSAADDTANAGDTADAPDDTADAGDADADSSEGSELALITDLGTIDDKSFNQGSWEGLVQYAEENNITHKYYQPTEQSDDAYLAAIDLAVKGGAKVIVTPGFLFEVPVYKAQDTYPDVHFVLVDGAPNNGDSENMDARINDNVVGLKYAEEQAGFLAGYAAVKDGMTKLGFMGGMAVPAVVRFGYGFVQGADFAAKEMGIDSVDVKYHYTGAFNASPEAQTMASSWFKSGTEVIFACGGAVGDSVMAAAKENDAKVIGVDVDQSSESDTVVTSAMKGLKASVYSAISDYYAGNFPGAQELIFDAKVDGVGLPMDTSKFDTFSQADYDAIYAKLVADEITIQKDIDVDSASEITVEIVKVEEIS